MSESADWLSEWEREDAFDRIENDRLNVMSVKKYLQEKISRRKSVSRSVLEYGDREGAAEERHLWRDDRASTRPGNQFRNTSKEWPSGQLGVDDVACYESGTRRNRPSGRNLAHSKLKWEWALKFRQESFDWTSCEDCHSKMRRKKESARTFGFWRDKNPRFAEDGSQG